MLHRRGRGVLHRGCLALATAWFAWSGTATADMITHTDSVPLTTTNWSSVLTIPRFDPAQGHLDAIGITLSGAVTGYVRFESLDGAPTGISSFLSADITLQRPDATVLAAITPSDARVDGVGAFDGLIDFGGSSGRTYTLNAEVSASDTLTNGVDLALFSGSGDMMLPVLASAFSGAGGAGSLVASIMTSASAEAGVTYHYTPVPAPSAALLGMIGFGFIDWMKRRHG